jgi:hypothetical protein
MSRPPRVSPQMAAALSASWRPQRARPSAAAAPVLTAVGEELLAPLRTGVSLVRGAAGLLSRHVLEQPGPPTPATEGPVPGPDQRVESPVVALERLHRSQVTMLIYELLDAHLDTAELATDLEHEPGWSAHLSYLNALQRYGRQVLAQIGTGDGA